MSDRVIVLVADANFLPHTKSLAVNVRRQGQTGADFLWIVPDDMFAPDVYDLTSRGAFVLPVRDRGFLMKFNLFHPYLKQWKQALFLDADCMVQRPLSFVWEQLDAAQPYADGCKPILTDREEVPVYMGWQVWDKDWRDHEAIYEAMSARFPHVFTEQKMYNTSMVAWEPASVPDDTVDQLRALQTEFDICNRPENGGTDEPIIDLLLHQRIRLMPRKNFCFWGLDCKPDERQDSRVPSESRGWDGTETPTVVHYGRWHAPWIKKPHDADGYFNDRIGDGVVTYNFYHENLAAFETVFPKVR